jgi:hypothetical protein
MVERPISRRGAVVAGAVAAAATAASGGRAAAAPTDDSVRGSWRITPQLPEGAPPFVALAAFGAGGVFITTGSDEPGTGIGQWDSAGPGEFSFAYTNFHFDGSGSLSSTVDAEASGTFDGDQLSGTATLRRVDPQGEPMGEPQESPFTGVRMTA